MVKMYSVQKEDPDVLDEAPINNISSINIEQTSYSISTIVKLLKEESLELSSNMQQVFDEWDSHKKSYQNKPENAVIAIILMEMNRNSVMAKFA